VSAESQAKSLPTALAIGLALLLFVVVIVLPALVGPILAPRLFETFGPIVCDGAKAHIEVTSRASRRGRSYDWHVKCEGRAPTDQNTGLGAYALSALLYGGGAVAVVALGAMGGSGLRKLARRARRP
jgi:hypothetical protein